jgi:outer membrane protein
LANFNLKGRSMTVKLCRSLAALVLAGLIVVAPLAPVYGQGQQPPSTPPSGAVTGQAVQPLFNYPAGPDYSVPKHIYPQFWKPYTPIQIPEPQYVNGPRLLQMIQNGKINLSLMDAIALALENNPDLAVQRYNSWIAETDLLRTKGGGAQRGVGGAVTTTQAFGVLPQLSFDPLVTATASIDSRVIPSTGNPSSLSTHTGAVNFGYSQAFHTGTSFAITSQNNRASTTSTSAVLNPAVQSTATLSFVQPLLNGFGLLPNERSIRLAVITKKAVDYAFIQSIITDITAVENDYWELVFARGNVGVQQQSVALAQQLYDDNQRQIQVGTLAPIELVRAEAQLASAQQSLITAQTVQIQQQIVLMNVITKNPVAPELQNVEVIPTDTMMAPPPVEDISLTDAVTEAIQNRPDVVILRVNLDADDINVRATRNALLPSLSVSGFVTSTAFGGDSLITHTGPGAGTTILATGGGPLQVVNTLTALPTTIILPNTTTTTTGVHNAGLPQALAKLFSGKNPEYEAQINFSVPIRNRVAQADSARAGLNLRQDQARYQQGVNNAAVDVQNALILLKQDRAAVISAEKADTLQMQTLDADQKRLAVGATTPFIVVQDQQNLAVAGSTQVRAQANLSEALVNFERAMARTLVAHGITVADGRNGNLGPEKLIPGTAANGELIGLKEAFAMLPNGSPNGAKLPNSAK